VHDQQLGVGCARVGAPGQGAKTYGGKNARERVVGMDVTTACTPCSIVPKPTDRAVVTGRTVVTAAGELEIGPDGCAY